MHWGGWIVSYNKMLEILAGKNPRSDQGTYINTMEISFCVLHYTALTHWDWVLHICISKLTTISLDNGLSPDRHQAIIWTNAGILLIGPLGTKISEILIEIHTFLFKKMHLIITSGKGQPFCIGLNILTHWHQAITWINLHSSAKVHGTFTIGNVQDIYLPIITHIRLQSQFSVLLFFPDNSFCFIHNFVLAINICIWHYSMHSSS